MVNNKTTQGLDSFKILRDVDQTSSDQALPNPPQLMNATKTPDTEAKKNFTDVLSLSGNENELNRNRNILLKILKTKDLHQLLINTQKGKPTFRGLLSSQVPNYLVKPLYHQFIHLLFIIALFKVGVQT